MTTRRRFTGAFKAKVALEALRGDKTIQEIATRHKGAPQPGQHLEAPGDGRSGRGVFQWCRQGPCGSCRRGPRPPRQDRSADGGAGFFVQRAQAMSRNERKAMIRRDCPGLSLSRQCALLSISRSSFYYAAKVESAGNLAMMRRIDELFLKYPFYGSRQMVRQLRREGVYIGRHRVRRLMD